MQFRELVEQGLAVGTGVTSVAGLVIWLFREKMGLWVDKRVDRKLEPLVKAVEDTEARVTHIESEATVTGETVKHLAESMKEHMSRQTQAMTALSSEVAAQGKDIAKISGALEARGLQR